VPTPPRRAARRTPGQTRRRRPPEEARGELLAAAEGLVARLGPDGVTLRRVAEAVGVTPGLVTHYFGTRQALVREVLGRQDALTRARVRRALDAGSGVPDAEAILGVLFAALSEPTRVRLFVWAHLRGDLERRSTGGLRDLVDELEARFRRTLPRAEVPDRGRIELVALLALSAIHGWAVGKRAWLAGLGLGPATPGRDQAFLDGLGAALRSLMAAG
jgi:AcrR family transcriptional regulator